MTSYTTAPLTDRRQFLARVAALGASLAGPTAWAQSGWPTKPLRLVVPYPAGGGMTRVFADDGAHVPVTVLALDADSGETRAERRGTALARLRMFRPRLASPGAQASRQPR